MPVTTVDPDLSALAQECGIPLGAYRRSHVDRCVERARVRTGTDSLPELIDRLHRDRAARAAFRRSVLVAVTGMFRDPHEFELLERVVIPNLARSRERIRVWSAGCANGQELCSVAELLDQAGLLRHASLLGSDVLPDALEAAAADRECLDVAHQAVIKYERRDLVLDPPPDRAFDLVLCRNVSIYLEPATQQELRHKLTRVLRPSGFLMLGTSETIVRPQGLGLTPVSRHIFRRDAA